MHWQLCAQAVTPNLWYLALPLHALHHVFAQELRRRQLCQWSSLPRSQHAAL